MKTYTHTLMAVLGIACISFSIPRSLHSNIGEGIELLDNYRLTIESVTHQFRHPSAEVLAIVFPETIRYTNYQKYFDTNRPGASYIEDGKKGAQFPIGPFLMDPAFIETLEYHVAYTPELLAQYQFVLEYPKGNVRDIRAERLKRLASFDWQLKYANCFYATAEHCFGGMKFKGKKERLAYYAAAYDIGFNESLEDINYWKDKATFPYGKHISSKSQIPYHQLSLQFYEEYFEQFNTNLSTP